MAEGTTPDPDLDPKLAEYASRLEDLGVGETLIVPENGTLSCPAVVTVPEDLPQLGDIVPGPVLGEGGMGVVRSAEQRALRRRVAVKQIHERHAGAAARVALFREALITGQIQHPNVVPVHALGTGQGGRPALVMKEVEGEPWSQLIDDPDPARMGGVEDPMEFHLEVFQRVCNAVHYAHSRGILHRDIKPENVMIGRFGEVYVMDWGIAVSLYEDEHLPVAMEGLSGTPEFMAPEMALGDPTKLSERTDVFLLAGTLHAVVAGGHGPYHAESPIESLYKAYEGELPDYDDTVPAELQQILRKALAYDPDQRHVSADALRRDVQAFLSHRTSHTLAARARELAASLDALEGTEHNKVGINAHFAYRQALEQWPGNTDARAGLQDLLVRLIEWELTHENAEGARALLSELPVPREDLEAQVEAVASEVVDRKEELQRLRGAWDIDAAAAMRRNVALRGVVLFGGLAVVAGLLHLTHIYQVDYAELIGYLVIAFGLSLADAVHLRKVVDNEASLRIARYPVVGTGALVFFVSAAWLLDVPFAETLALAMLLLGSVMAAVASTMTWRLLVPAAAFAIGGVIIGLAPKWDLELFGVFTPLGFGALAWAWSISSKRKG